MKGTRKMMYEIPVTARKPVPVNAVMTKDLREEPLTWYVMSSREYTRARMMRGILATAVRVSFLRSVRYENPFSLVRYMARDIHDETRSAIEMLSAP